MITIARGAVLYVLLWACGGGSGGGGTVSPVNLHATWNGSWQSSHNPLFSGGMELRLTQFAADTTTGIVQIAGSPCVSASESASFFGQIDQGSRTVNGMITYGTIFGTDMELVIDGVVSSNSRRITGHYSVLVGACTGDMGSFSVDRPMIQDLTGTWVGTWNSSRGFYSGSGAIDLDISQTGASLSGTGHVFGMPGCINEALTATCSGILENQDVSLGWSFSIPSSSPLSFSGTLITPQLMTGTYTTNCAGDSGTISLTKVGSTSASTSYMIVIYEECDGTITFESIPIELRK